MNSLHPACPRTGLLMTRHNAVSAPVAALKEQP